MNECDSTMPSINRSLDTHTLKIPLLPARCVGNSLTKDHLNSKPDSYILAELPGQPLPSFSSVGNGHEMCCPFY